LILLRPLKRIYPPANLVLITGSEKDEMVCERKDDIIESYQSWENDVFVCVFGVPNDCDMS